MPRRLLRPGIRVQFVSVMVIASVVFGTSVLAFLQVLVVDALERTTEENYGQLIEVLAPSVADHVLTEQTLDLQLLLHETARRDPLLEYLVVVDEDHEVIATSFGGQLPDDIAPILEIADRQADKGQASTLVRDRGRDILHLRAVLIDPEVGFVHAGIDQEPMRDSARGITTNLALLFVILTLAGIGLAFVVGRFITEPLREMTALATRIGDGDLSGRIPVRSADEVGELASAFNSMTTQLAESREALVRTEKLAAAGRLAAGVAHEINNPLASLRACLWVLRKPDIPDEDRQRHQDALDRGLSRIAQTVQRLLEFARPSALRRGPADLAEVALSALRLVLPAVTDCGIRIDTDFEDDIGELAVDATQVEQVLVNLLLNAIHALRDSDMDGTIRIRLQAIDGGQRLEVEDDGPGIPADDLARVFRSVLQHPPGGQGDGPGAVRVPVHRRGARREPDPRALADRARRPRPTRPPRSSRIGPLPGLDPQLLDLGPQVLAADPQRLGCAGAVAVVGVEHPPDVGGLEGVEDLLEGTRLVTGHPHTDGACRRGERWREVLRQDLGALAQQDRPLHQVLQLPGISL